jgi:hypothetical protein
VVFISDWRCCPSTTVSSNEIYLFNVAVNNKNNSKTSNKQQLRKVIGAKTYWNQLYNMSLSIWLPNQLLFAVACCGCLLVCLLFFVCCGLFAIVCLVWFLLFVGCCCLCCCSFCLLLFVCCGSTAHVSDAMGVIIIFLLRVVVLLTVVVVVVVVVVLLILKCCCC